MTKLESRLIDEADKLKRLRWRTFDAIRKRLEERDLRSTPALLAFKARKDLVEDWIEKL